MVAMSVPDWIEAQLTAAERVRLFLDYDGTLADFAPTPEHIDPSPEIVGLLTRLADHPRFRVSVVSGRRLGHVEQLVPVTGILLAGTYGVELRLPGGERVERVAYGIVRPPLETVKPCWASLLAGREGFFLEDKGWALALHARFAEADEAEHVLQEARAVANGVSPELFRVLGGHRFLEIGPRLAHKGRTVDYLLARYPWPDALPVYLGDDDKDEEAFEVIKAHAGITILVGSESRESQADGRLASPQAARRWLEERLSGR
jgi:trehalose-phosphatase